MERFHNIGSGLAIGVVIGLLVVLPTIKDEIEQLQRRCDTLESALALRDIHVPPPPWERRVFIAKPRSAMLADQAKLKGDGILEF